jgi:tungstate transport system substrate-binding protein
VQSGSCAGLILRVLAASFAAPGPGKAEPVELIGETGSLSAAARRLGMSCRRLGAALAFALMAQPLAAADLKLAATHTLEDSGLLARLIPAFEAKSGFKVRLTVGGTGQVVRLAANGDVDAVLSHVKAQEEKLVASGAGLARYAVAYNDFFIAGPPEDPARVRGTQDAADALRKIYLAKARFVSRGDESGTHVKERELWLAAGLEPKWPGYRSAGAGMGSVLMMASEMQAYTLCDRATFAALRARSGLEVLASGDRRLYNEYAVVAVSPARFPGINGVAADRFVSWITSSEAQGLIAGYRIGGQQVFFLPGKAR